MRQGGRDGAGRPHELCPVDTERAETRAGWRDRHRSSRTRRNTRHRLSACQRRHPEQRRSGTHWCEWGGRFPSMSCARHTIERCVATVKKACKNDDGDRVSRGDSERRGLDVLNQWLFAREDLDPGEVFVARHPSRPWYGPAGAREWPAVPTRSALVLFMIVHSVPGAATEADAILRRCSQRTVLSSNYRPPATGA